MRFGICLISFQFKLLILTKPFQTQGFNSRTRIRILCEMNDWVRIQITKTSKSLNLNEIFQIYNWNIWYASPNSYHFVVKRKDLLKVFILKVRKFDAFSDQHIFIRENNFSSFRLYFDLLTRNVFFTQEIQPDVYDLNQ
jgi:hypothetical protein